MRRRGVFRIFASVFLLSTAPAHAVQISLSGDSVDRYFRILEHYVLPLMVVSTIVLFCGYLASRIYHRTTARGVGERDLPDARDDVGASPYDGTAAFLRELRATPPIEDTEPKREPRARATHPLLRRRASSAAAALRARPAPEERLPESAAEPPPAAPSPPRSPDRPTERTTERSWTEPAPAPRVERAPRVEQAPLSDRQAAPLGSSPAPNIRDAWDPAAWEAAAQRREPAQQAPRGPESRDADADSLDVEKDEGREHGGREPFADGGLRADRTQEDAPQRSAAERGTDGAKVEPPPIAMTPNWWQDSDDPARVEPSASVVQSLKTTATAPVDLETARAKAAEIADRLEYAAGILQNGASLVAERAQAKQGLDLEDVRGMRMAEFERPQNLEEELRKLGGDVAQEAMRAVDAVARFENVLRRLEQMAETEPLDEGWNDLLRTRISDTLYQIGQVRKTLGSYRKAPASRKPPRSSDKHARPGGAGGPDRPVPVGRRQI